MKKTGLLFVLFLICSPVFSQNKKKLSFKIRNLIEQQEGKIRPLYNYRGAPQSWIKTIDVNGNLITEVLYNYRKNVVILVYSFE